MRQQARGLQLIACLAICGCSVDLGHGPLVSPDRVQSGTVATYWRAGGQDFKLVGRAGPPFPLGLVLPGADIEIDGDGNERVGMQVRDALKLAGYTVTIVNRQLPVEGPVLDYRVTRFWFGNPTYVPIAGKIELVADLVAPDNVVRWSRQFSGSGLTFNFWDGFSTAASGAITEIANDMVREFSGEEFRRAVAQY